MDVNFMNEAEKFQLRKDLPNFEPGDTIAVHTILREGDKQRTQIFKGIVLAIKGAGLGKTFTIRKISFNVGVEKIFPINSPNIEKIEFIKKGKVRRSKLYYMRDRVGKKATKITEGKMSEEMKKQHEDLTVTSEEKTEKETEPKEETKTK